LNDYEAILFDFDGVLVDSEPVHYACWVEILKPFSIPLPWQEYCERCIGISDREMAAFLAQRADPPIAFDTLWAEYPRKKQITRDRMLRDGIFKADVARLLGKLRSRYLLGVVTSSGQTEVEPILDSAGVLPLLGATVYGGDVARHKPAPDPYLLALDKLGVRRALVIEDSQAGLESARRAGLDVLHVPVQQEVCRLVREKLSPADYTE
jgi:HAD superfamily hydrolase (TIGR01509 family)